MTSPRPTDWNLLERILRRDRLIVVVALFALTTLAWVYLVMMAVDMSGGDMSMIGMSGNMESTQTMGSMQTMPWTGTTFAFMFVMWWVMMVGMMVPSAAPMILLYSQLKRKVSSDEHPFAATAAFTSGYAAAWAGFSVVAVLLQWIFNQSALLSPMLVSSSEFLGAALFITAGLYQLTPVKLACLRHCRSPAHFLSSHWHKGTFGAFRIGLEHGVYCVGCCWFLMGLLFLGGVMNLFWVAAIAGFVIVEKLVPGGETVARVVGAVMIAYGIFLLF